MSSTRLISSIFVVALPWLTFACAPPTASDTPASANDIVSAGTSSEAGEREGERDQPATPVLADEIVGRWKVTNVGRKTDNTGVIRFDADGTCEIEEGFSESYTAFAPADAPGSSRKGTYRLIEGEGWTGAYIGFAWNERADSVVSISRFALITSTKLRDDHLSRFTYSLQGHTHGVETLERMGTR